MKGNNFSFRHDVNKRGKVTPSNPSPNSFMRKNERNASRTRSPRGRSPSGSLDGLARITLKELAPIHSVKRWHPPECLFYKTKSGCRFGEKCSFAHRQVDEQPTKRSKTNDDKKYSSYVEEGKLARKRTCHRWMSRSTRGTEVIRNWDKIRLNVILLMYDNWVAYFRT